MAPAQAVAFSTRSSLASLPAMLEGAQMRLGLSAAVSGLVLPLAVALLRITSPIVNIAAAIFAAGLFGISLPNLCRNDWHAGRTIGPGERPRRDLLDRRSVMSLRGFVFLLIILIAGSPAMAPAQSAVLTEATEARIAAVEANVIAWRRDIHQHPELGNREFRTAQLVADHLRALGLEVQTGVAHTGVVGLLRGGKPGPVVLLRADMDALPVTERVDLPFASRVRTIHNGEEVGVMHACGHDTHVAILMGVAEILAGMRDEMPGTVKFVFQPAEEGPPVGEEGGAALMIKEGVLTNPAVDAAFALHIDAFSEVGTLSYSHGGIYASVDDFRITVRGRSSHGAAPWEGVDPIVTAAHIITSLQTIVSRQVPLTEGPAVVSIGSIRGGNRSNIIPEQVEMIGTLRTLDPKIRQLLHERVRLIATNVAESMGATAEIEIPYSDSSAPVTYNDPDLTAAMVPVLEAVAGPGRVAVAKPELGAEDFGFIAERIPSFYFILGGRPSKVPREAAADHHTPDFYIDESGLILGVRSMTALALAYLSSSTDR